MDSQKPNIITNNVELFKVGPLYSANLNSKAKICVNQGGTSSGKTYSILQVIFTILSQEKAVCTVVGQDIPNLKAGALRDALKIYDSSEVLKSLIKSYNKTDRIFFFNNGSELEFKSYEDAQDAKSGKREYCFINEANGIVHDIFEQLYWRTTEKMWIDYNPNAEFWAHELKGDVNIQFFYSDHRHNPFLSQASRDKIEAIKQKDETLWKVYARGLTGRIEGLIFRKWSLGEVPTTAQFIAGGKDFGFTNDPTTLVDVYEGDGNLYLDERYCQTGLTNPDINKLLTSLGYNKGNRIIADSADPKSIEELRRMGWRIEGANKGPDSIIAGINKLKEYKLVVTHRSVNLRKELNNYKWKVDKLGNPENIPVDFFNHCIDPIRYVALNCLGKSEGIRAHVARERR